MARFTLTPTRTLCALALLACTPGLHAADPAPVLTGADTDVATPRAGDRVTLDFVNAEIDAVARTMATLTGRNVVVDPRVKGTLSLTSTTPVTPTQALDLFAAQLRTQGFALIESSGIVLVLPESEAKLQSGAVSAGRVHGGGQIQTQIFRLTHENANNLVPILRPLISPNNTINVNPGTNALVITDYGDNLQRLGRIIAALDVSNATGVEIVRLKHAVASDLAPLVARLLESGASGSLPGPVAAAPQAAGAQAAGLSVGSGGGYHTTILPEPRSNALILRAANPARLALARTLIEQLDQPPSRLADGTGSNIHVVYLKNAEAAKLAVTLRAALAALPGQAASSGGGAGAATGATAQATVRTSSASLGGNSSGLASGPTIDAAASNQPSTGGQIQADPATNALIISAPEPVYRELRTAIDQLDQRRAQVYVESLIAEVRADKAAEFGIQWQGILGKKGDTNIGVIGTNYGAGSTNIIDFSAQFIGAGSSGWTPTTPPSAGLNLGLVHRFGATYALAALANFLQSTGTGNVLSAPTLLTLDNEEASIMVGRNVPFVTGSFTNTGASGGTVNPFQTYERKDVGLTLRVRPQISENGTVKMVIYQETSSVEPTSVNSPQGLITNKRAIESSVLVDDGAIIVLGGLMEDQFTESEDKVPGLGDIPVVGNLFKSRSRGITKSNLMVFLRPVVVRDAIATEQFSLDRYDLMRSAQQGNQPQPSSVLQINQAPVLPAVQPTSAEGWTRPAPPPPLIEMPASGEANYLGR
ncbi:MAG TPA: type II secretion system secretin GspD [Ottowia sp.]|uniref:type II secretion system secretin GspD n=1 Tax=Ottowia sp. TaxID=1898956 RepID=UPI002CACDD3B|nr:type II secretion system secretin GspD [Ottowia sp.]HMN19769.1 type II secretion system secretin GspD [Ottowia sp.]